MKRIATALALVCIALSGSAQQDTIEIVSPDTIRAGNMIIIRSGRDRDRTYFDSTERRFRRKNSNVTTNWFIVDIGLNQFSDKTDYAGAITDGYLPSGANEDWFNLRNIKSTNVNIWIVMQRLNLIKHVVNLKYGLGVELNNYRYTSDIRYQETAKPMVILDDVDYRKNKLAADYFTIPIMLNFDFDRSGRFGGLGFSAGISAGYLYSSRQKLIGEESGKRKYRDDFELRKFKIAYVAELGLGPIKLYGSYATRSMFEHGLDQTPYSFGLRLSHM